MKELNINESEHVITHSLCSNIFHISIPFPQDAFLHLFTACHSLSAERSRRWCVGWVTKDRRTLVQCTDRCDASQIGLSRNRSVVRPNGEKVATRRGMRRRKVEWSGVERQVELDTRRLCVRGSHRIRTFG